MRIAKIARFYNPAIDYVFIVLPVLLLQEPQGLLQELQGLLRVPPVLLLQGPQGLPVPQELLLQEPQELPVLPLSSLLPSGPACSLLPRLIKKPIKAR
ncbi:MAG: hypothetical protein PHN98_00895 [Smithellaceae bacterium]|nr:hypothetical protein [Smithellaceae bacterium]